MWSAWIGYFSDYLDVSFSYRYTGSIYDDDKTYADNTYGSDDDCHLMDAELTFRPMDCVAVSVSVENLLDEEYYEYYKGTGRFWLETVTFTY